MTLCDVVGILYFVSATLNPILYNVMSVRYRRAFHDTLQAALIAAHCRRPASPATAGPSSDHRHNWPLIHGRHSEGNIGHSQTVSRRARSAECIKEWTMPPNSQMKSPVSRHQTMTLTVCHTLSDDGRRMQQQ